MSHDSQVLTSNHLCNSKNHYLEPRVDGVVAAHRGEELGEERDEEVVGRDDVHEEVVGHLADLKK